MVSSLHFNSVRWNGWASLRQHVWRLCTTHSRFLSVFLFFFCIFLHLGRHLGAPLGLDACVAFSSACFYAQNLHRAERGGAITHALQKNDDTADNAAPTYEPPRSTPARVWQANTHTSISRVTECISVCITCCRVAAPLKSISNMKWLLNISHPTSNIAPLIS